MHAYSPCPKYMTGIVTQDDPYIQAISLSIDHSLKGIAGF